MAAAQQQLQRKGQKQQWHTQQRQQERVQRWSLLNQPQK